MEKKNEDKEGSPDKSIRKGSATTQGGSDHGQGSSYLAGEEAYHQGSEKEKGADYDNESADFGDIEGVRETTGNDK